MNLIEDRVKLLSCSNLLQKWAHSIGLCSVFTSPPTQYRLYGRRFLQVKRPNQQYQSTRDLELSVSETCLLARHVLSSTLDLELNMFPVLYTAIVQYRTHACVSTAERSFSKFKLMKIVSLALISTEKKSQTA